MRTIPKICLLVYYNIKVIIFKKEKFYGLFSILQQERNLKRILESQSTYQEIQQVKLVLINVRL